MITNFLFVICQSILAHPAHVSASVVVIGFLAQNAPSSIGRWSTEMRFWILFHSEIVNATMNFNFEIHIEIEIYTTSV